MYYVCISRLDVAFWASGQEDIREASGSGLVWAEKVEISRMQLLLASVFGSSRDTGVVRISKAYLRPLFSTESLRNTSSS